MKSKNANIIYAGITIILLLAGLWIFFKNREETKEGNEEEMITGIESCGLASGGTLSIYDRPDGMRQLMYTDPSGIGTAIATKTTDGTIIYLSPDISANCKKYIDKQIKIRGL